MIQFNKSGFISGSSIKHYLLEKVYFSVYGRVRVCVCVLDRLYTVSVFPLFRVWFQQKNDLSVQH